MTKVLPGGRVLFKNANLMFQRGAKIGILGSNGSGKSSLLKILAKIDREFDGKVWHNEGVRIGYLQQEPQLDASKDVQGNVMDGLREKTTLLSRMDELSSLMGEPDADMDALMAEMSTVQERIDAMDCWNLGHTVEIAKKALRVPPDNANVTTLSGGERRRVALCRLLLEEPDVLLLDEPTNHLDAQSIEWLEGYLQAYKGTVVAITHDRYFLDNVAGWILEIDRGQMYPYAGNYSVWLEKKSARLDLESKQDRRRQKAMEEELQWIQRGARAQQSKSKARVSAYDDMVAEHDRIRLSQKFSSGVIAIPPSPRLGDIVVNFDNVTISVAGRVLLNKASFVIPKGAILGVIGPNGAGKTTLLRAIAGELKPDSGTITRGNTLQLGYVSQSRSDLKPTDQVVDAVGMGSETVELGEREVHIRAYLASFNIVGDLQTKLVGSLSGGERNRVHLARTLRFPCNLLLLDEPTNDLDVDTLRSLEEALQEYTGCAVIVSHDRYFLDRLCTHMLVFGPEGRVDFWPGNFTEYEQTVLGIKR